MSRHRRPFSLPAALTALAASAAVAGCSPGGSEARVEPPSAPPADVAGLCAALHKELPETVASLDRAPALPKSDLTAAWGGSAIVLRCGVGKPVKMLDPKQDGIEVNGVGWLVERLDDGGVRFTTGLRMAYTEVLVDKEHATDAGMLVGLSAAIAKTVPVGIASS
ncbi:DUF3515 domain-containing protein [Streptomyces sp. NPDC006450]|uniref:DUF3515 domain-containing protein n=1 Tax=Streptomyces sp. NPDC006450 TaxID=3155458 RepID=UPI0033A4F579